MELYGKDMLVTSSITLSAVWRGIGSLTYECEPSDKAMNGSNGHSFSDAGSEPSSTPIHVSISGPLFNSISTAFVDAKDKVPCVMKADDADNRFELRLCRHCERNGSLIGLVTM